jgi:uncharacterized membrane protein
MTTLAPLIDAPLTLQVHIAAALTALLLGPFVLLRQRRDRLHRALGRVWIGAMLVVALGSFALESRWALIGPFGPIHLLSVLALFSLFQGLRAAMQRRFDVHRAYMQSLYLWGLAVTAVVTLLPGRTLHRVVFGTDSVIGFALVAAAAAVVLLWVWLRLGQGRKAGAGAAFPLHSAE